MRTPPRALRAQRGAAALIVTMVLFFAMLLIAAFANRGLLFEQRASANQYRATQAFEAAEAGLEWALAQLNNPQPLGADCQASSTAGALPLRERLLRYNASLGSHEVLSWNNAGSPLALQAACVRSVAGWACSCPASGYPAPSALLPEGGAAQPAFVIQMASGTPAGVLQLRATGCTHLAGACQPGVAGGTPPDAVARVQVALALVPGLATLPNAPLTVRDGVATTAAIGLHNADAGSGGAVLQAGGNVDAPAARVTTPPGGSGIGALASGDASLGTRSAASLFATYFGVDKASWRGQSAVRRIDCAAGPCAAELGVAAAAGQRLFWIDGDLALDGPLTLGTPERPVILAVAGALALRGAVVLHGVGYAGAIAWSDAPSGGVTGWVRGALISEASYTGSAAPDLVYDSAVLERLRADSGSFTRVPGSWRDF